MNCFIALFNEVRHDCMIPATALCDSMNCRCGRKLLQEHMIQYIEANYGISELGFTTVILDRGLIPAGSLNRDCLEGFNRAVKRYVKETGVSEIRIIGFFDFEFTTTHPARRGQAFWHLHLHMIVHCRDINEFTKELRRAIKTKQSVLRPVFTEPVNDLERLVFYCLKPVQEMHCIQYTAGGMRLHAKDISGAELVELIKFVETTELRDFLFLMGFDCAPNFRLTPIPDV